jgi:hypothetical protein
MAATVFCLRAGGKCTGDMFLLMPELRAARNKITIAQLVLLRKIPRKPSKMTGYAQANMALKPTKAST